MLKPVVGPAMVHPHTVAVLLLARTPAKENHRAMEAPRVEPRREKDRAHSMSAPRAGPGAILTADPLRVVHAIVRVLLHWPSGESTPRVATDVLELSPVTGHAGVLPQVVEPAICGVGLPTEHVHAAVVQESGTVSRPARGTCGGQ